MNEFELNK